MKRPRRYATWHNGFAFIRIASLIVLLAAPRVSLSAFAAQLSGEGARTPASQTDPKISRFAAQTATKIAKFELRKILTTPLAGCLGAPEICAELDAALRADIESSIAGTQFISRDNAVAYLDGSGFLALDAYMGALNDVAAYAGAELVVGENFLWEGNSCKLQTTMVDAKRHYQLADLSTKISCPAVSGKPKLSVLKDAATGVSMIVSTPQPPNAPPDAAPIQYPTCVKCPDPHYSAFARERHIEGSVHILVTVTEQGAPQDARVVGMVEESLARVSLEAVDGWRFKPATGNDGKPFPARVTVDVSFRLLH